MKVSIYSREEIEKLIGKGFPKKTAVISFYDPPNIRTGEISEPGRFRNRSIIKACRNGFFKWKFMILIWKHWKILVCRLIRISRKRIVLRRLYKRLMMTASI